MNLIIVAIVAILVFLFLTKKDKTVEGISTGALIQLYAKGPQDTYLTGDAWKYSPYWFPYYYNYGWNTYYPRTGYGRLNYNYYRPYGLRYLY